jgi:hypothetical protein
MLIFPVGVEHALDVTVRGSLEAELIALKSRFEDEDSRSRELFSARNRAEDRIASVSGDAAVAILDTKRQTVLLNIEDRALAYLRLKLGTAAADRALRAYRDRHQSSMMKNAPEAFALISRGAYSELVTQPSNGNELLIAKGSGGGSKIASELSKGTRFQLYLALHVAGSHEFARVQPRKVKVCPIRNASISVPAKRLATFLGRSPDRATAEELRAFQLHPTETGAQPPSINATVTALRFSSLGANSGANQLLKARDKRPHLSSSGCTPLIRTGYSGRPR